MKNLFKKALAMVLAFLLVLVMLPVGILGVYAAQEGDYTYGVTASQAKIIEYTGLGGDISIPDMLGGFPVTRIEARAFEYCAGLTSVIIPDSVTSIGTWVFTKCDALTSVIIGTGVTSISVRTFDFCTGLTSVTIRGNVTSIGEGAFYTCSALASVIIPASVTSIGNNAFYSCSSLTNVTIPGSVTSMGTRVFLLCSDLLQISVDSGNSDFSGQDGVLLNKDKTTLVQYPGGKVGAYTIPASVTSIGNEAFAWCSDMTSVTIPDTVMEIGMGAFFQCIGLASVAIPNSETVIWYGAFSGCSGLTSITIPDGFTQILESVFESCTGLTSVIIPSSVENIDDWAFGFCTGLASIIIPPGVTSIGERAFKDCEDLTIYGFTGSYAETYAAGHTIPFVALITEVSGSGCVIDGVNGMVYGLAPGINSLEGYAIAAPGFTLEYEPTNAGFGTGTLVNVIKTTSGEPTASVTIVIFGDVNGDGNIDSIDAGKIIDHENDLFSWDEIAHAAQLKAGDLNGDDNVDSIDAGFVVGAENCLLAIDQTTGLVN